MQEVLVGDWIPVFCSSRTHCLFHSIHVISCSKGCRNQWHLEWERNPWFGRSSLLIRPDKADPWFPALLKASSAHHGDGDSALLTFLPTPLYTNSDTWELYIMSGNTLQAGFLQSLFTHLKCQLGYFAPPSLPLLLPDPHLTKQMKCQEEMSLQQASSLWGISCTLIMVFVLWVVKFPSDSPVWSQPLSHAKIRFISSSSKLWTLRSSWRSMFIGDSTY